MNVIIVHGSNEDEESSKAGGVENTRHWLPWLKESLEGKGIEVSRELYPRDWNPDYEEWKNIFEKNLINGNTILVGHSAGCAFILRWLGDTKNVVKKVVLVAPCSIKEDELPLLKSLLDFRISENLSKFSDSFVIFYSDNDYEVILRSVNLLKDKIRGDFIEIKGAKHFCGEDGFKEFPELLDEILKE